MTPMTYFAQPIDQSGHSVTKMALKAREWAHNANIALFLPAQAYQLGHYLDSEMLAQVDQINRDAFANCGATIAVLPAGVATLGVPAEIEQSLAAGKATIIVTDATLMAVSVQLQSWSANGAWVLNVEDLPGADDLVEFILSWQRPPVPTYEFSFKPQPVGQTMPFVRTSEAATVPTRAYPDDAGLDLAVSKFLRIDPGASALVPTNLAFALPEGTFGLIVGRSSTWVKRGLDVKLGVIDAGWRGELFVSVHNPTDQVVWVEQGDRLAQYIVLPAWTGKLEALGSIEALPPHARGTNGFGSSGV